MMKFEQNYRQQQKQVQKLAMTQQLQQSIQVLQFNSDELFRFLEQKALENPLIDVKVSDTPDYSPSHTSTNRFAEENNYLNQIPDNHVSLFEYLIDQVHLNYRDTYLRSLILFLVEYIDLNGYLTISLEEACAKTEASYIQMLDALTLIQQLDPAGIGARNLQECLMLQTERDDEAPQLAYLILEEAFDDLVQRKWAQIAKKYQIELSEIQKIFDYIQTLSPAPGAAFGQASEQYVIPDVTVKVIDGKISVTSNRRSMPKIQFQSNYFEKMQQTGDKEVQTYLKEKKQEFEWLEKTITQRGDTILNVALEIVKRQSDFFLLKDHPLKPMMLKELAKELDVHESTISRTVNGKYLETDFGIFEFRSFFSFGLQTESGEEGLSTDSVKRQLQLLIDEENKAKPLSDQKIVELLKEQEIELSRRTVAKYRDALGIPSSSKRKRYDK